MRGGPRWFNPGFTCPDLLRDRPKEPLKFRLRGSNPLRPGFPARSATHAVCDSFGRAAARPRPALQPRLRNARRLSRKRFGLFPFRSPLLRESRLSFFSSGYSDVSFPRVPSSHPMRSGAGDGALPPPGFPIRRSVLHSPLAASHGLSQLATSFFGFPVPRHPPYALTILMAFGFALCSFQRSDAVLSQAHKE